MGISAKRALGWILAAAAGGGIVNLWPVEEEHSRKVVKDDRPSSPEALVQTPVKTVKPEPSGVNASETLTGSAPRNSTSTRGPNDDPLPNAIVYGLAVDTNGEVSAETRIDLTGPTKDGFFARVNAAGYYSVPSVPPGTWSVKASAPDHADATTAVEITEGVKYKRVDLTLQPSRIIKIRFVTKDGRRLSTVLAEAGLKVGLSGVSPAALATKERLPENLPVVPYRQAVNSKTGYYRDRPTQESDGELELHDDFPIHVTAAVRSLAFDRIVLTAPVDSLDLMIDDAALVASLASLRCQVIDMATGTGLAGAHVSLGDRQGGGQGGTCDTDGVFTFRNVVPGLLVLSASAKTPTEHYQEYVRMEKGQTLSRRVELRSTVTIRGSVIDVNGAPVKVQGTIYAVPDRLSPASTPNDLGGGWAVKDNGAFEVTLAKRPHLLTPHYPGFAISTLRIDPTSGPLDELRIVVVKGHSVTLRFSGPLHTRPLVFVRDSAGISLWSGYVVPMDLPLTLAPGTYRLEIHPSDSPPRTQEFSVADSAMVVTALL